MAPRLLDMIMSVSRRSNLNYSSDKSIAVSKLGSKIGSSRHVRVQSRATNSGARARESKNTAIAKRHGMQEDVDAMSLSVRAAAEFPETVRSTLPINFLQTSSHIEEAKLLENVLLGPNRKLAVPWPSYSERQTVRKEPCIVYPAVTEPPERFRRDMTKAGLEVQKRGISRFSKILNKEEVMHRVSKNSTGLPIQFGQISSSMMQRFKSSSRDDCEEEVKEVEKRRVVICKASIKKKYRKHKTLPRLDLPNCPCPESIPLRDVHLKKLKPRYRVRDPPRYCTTKHPLCVGSTRADDGMRIREKELPKITPGECPCTETYIHPSPKLKRLKFKEIKEPPREICREEGDCTDIPRSDKDDWEYIVPAECLEEEKK